MKPLTKWERMFNAYFPFLLAAFVILLMKI